MAAVHTLAVSSNDDLARLSRENVALQQSLHAVEAERDELRKAVHALMKAKYSEKDMEQWFTNAKVEGAGESIMDILKDLQIDRKAV